MTSLPRRSFLRLAAGAAAATGFCPGCGMRRAFAQANPGGTRRKVEVDGKQVLVVDVHCHCVIPEALAVVEGTPLEKRFRTGLDSKLANPPMEDRIATMDAAGIDVGARGIT